ncbi:hypothetical protein ACO0RG_000678 [Hanseniaspora osmophila]
MDSFEQKTTNFTDWTATAAAINISDGVVIKDFRQQNQGRAVIAEKDIKKGDTLFKIPRSTLLNVTTGAIAKDKTVAEALLHKIGHWEGLILCIFYELKMKKESSFWYAYFNVLPDMQSSKPFDNLLYWNDEELQKLQPSLVLSRVGVEQSREMFENCVAYAKDFGFEFTFDWKEFLYVASLIMSYSFDTERADYNGDSEDEDLEILDESQTVDVYKDGYYKSMVPLADMLNADTHLCNANLTYSETHLVMVATRDIKAGEQIFNTYGDHPNSELLRRYGYVEWAGSKYDFGEITMANIFVVLAEVFGKKIDDVAALLEAISDDIDLLENVLEGEPIVIESYDCYNEGDISLEGVCLIQVLCLMLEFELTTSSPNFTKIVKKCIKQVSKSKITQRCQQVLKKVLEVRISEYPENGNQEVLTKPGSNYILSMAQRVLNSEVLSIKECLNKVDQNYKCVEAEEYIPNIDFVGKKRPSKEAAPRFSKKQRR